MSGLEPVEVWKYFEEILKIPRPSKKEEKIIEYLEQFAQSNKLEFKKDSAGNCLICKAAKPGFEDRETIILQSHMDMVGEKLMQVEHDFDKDPITTKIENGWMLAEGTTLGADDGIGIAASLAILSSDTIEHGPLECLFTVDEETGMTGAFGLQPGFMKGKILLNLDSEDEGEIFIGCAGGIDTVGRFKKRLKAVKKGRLAYRMVVEGLQGGHSGDEIHKGFGNAIKILNRTLWSFDRKYNINIVSFSGGKMRNAIPREAVSSFVIKEDQAEAMKEHFTSMYRKLHAEIYTVEPAFKMEIEEIDLPDNCYTNSFQRRLMNMIYACPHGVISWSHDIEGLVETSTNMAVLKDENEDYVELVTSQRSSVESAKIDIASRMESLFVLANGEAIHSDGYPGWKPNTDSVILKKAEQLYKELFHSEPDVKAIHAGLECGLFLEKYPYLDMISFGPTIKGAHTPEERMEIETVGKFWDFLLALLKEAPGK